MTKLILGVFFAISFFFDGYSMHGAGSQFQLLAYIANYFKIAQLCGHKCEVFVSPDEYTRRNITFNTTVGKGEDPNELCKCILNYINQENWLGDVTHVCVHRFDLLTFVLLGPSNPHDNPNITPFTKPISALCSVLKHFRNAEVGDYICTSKCGEDRGLTRIELHCTLTCELPSPAFARQNIETYMSQCNLLTNASVAAKVEGKHLDIIIVGK